MTKLEVTVPGADERYGKELEISGDSVASGEAVALEVRGTGLSAKEANGPDGFLRVRLHAPGMDLAQYPEPKDEARWTESGGALRATLRLDTAQLYAAFRGMNGGGAPCAKAPAQPLGLPTRLGLAAATGIRPALIVERVGGDEPQLFGLSPLTVLDWPLESPVPVRDIYAGAAASLYATKEDFRKAAVTFKIDALADALQAQFGSAYGPNRPTTQNQTVDFVLDLSERLRAVAAALEYDKSGGQSEGGGDAQEAWPEPESPGDSDDAPILR